MFARLCAKIFLVTAGIALIFFGVGFIALAIATALKPYLGAAWADAIAGVIFLTPPLIWALAVASMRPSKPTMSAGTRQIVAALLAGLAKETPWIAVAGAGLAGIADLFLNRNKSKK